MSVSSLFESNKLVNFRKKVFYLILYWSILLSAGSFIARFMGINFMTSYWGKDISAVGYFGGLTNHSMLLGPISGLSTIFLIYRFLITKNSILLILAVMSIGSLMFSASRAALLSTILGLAVLIYILNKSSKYIIQYSILLIILGSITFPYWNNALSGVAEKNGGSAIELSTSTRDSKWENRLNEFESDPLLGIGFSCVDLNNHADYSSEGGTETGSSWLSVLSMTGILGASTLLIILIKAFSNIYHSSAPDVSLVGAILMFFIVSMMAEGYIFAGGNFLCIMFWLSLGRAIDINSFYL
ncbi:MAG: O-antigen ligase family protein [Allobaculum sp.]|nr:O-antigen ligase family protein [Allobaculum sp.]